MGFTGYVLAFCAKAKLAIPMKVKNTGTVLRTLFIT
jgi:hypothetical protein